MSHINQEELEQPWQALNISATEWADVHIHDYLFCHDYIINNSIPAESELTREQGVYFLILDNLITYVGQSKDIYLRVEKHFYRKQFNKVFTLEIEQDLLIDNIEAYYIHKFEPHYNTSYPPRKGATIANREFKLEKRN